jgi:hypothetical protein
LTIVFIFIHIRVFSRLRDHHRTGHGLVSAVGGLYAGFERDLSPGPAIVLLTLAVFVLAATAGRLSRRRPAVNERELPALAVDSGAEV